MWAILAYAQDNIFYYISAIFYAYYGIFGCFPAFFGVFRSLNGFRSFYGRIGEYGPQTVMIPKTPKLIAFYQTILV